MSISYQHAQFSSLHILFRIIEINSSLFSLFVISLVNDSSSKLTLLSEHVDDSFPLENIFQKTIYFFKALGRGLNLLRPVCEDHKKKLLSPPCTGAARVRSRNQSPKVLKSKWEMSSMISYSIKGKSHRGVARMFCAEEKKKLWNLRSIFDYLWIILSSAMIVTLNLAHYKHLHIRRQMTHVSTCPPFATPLNSQLNFQAVNGGKRTIERPTQSWDPSIQRYKRTMVHLIRKQQQIAVEGGIEHS